MNIIGTVEVRNVRLRELREDNDLTQKMLAELLHISQNSYSQYETGARQLPLEILIQLAKYYHTSTDYILCITDESKPYPSSSKNLKNGQI